MDRGACSFCFTVYIPSTFSQPSLLYIPFYNLHLDQFKTYSKAQPKAQGRVIVHPLPNIKSKTLSDSAIITSIRSLHLINLC